MGILNKFFNETWSLALEMAPYLWIGLIAAGCIRIWLQPKTAQRLLGGRGWKKNLQATLVGIPLPVCSCGIVPIAAGLRKSGAGPGPTLSFMTATPQTGVDSVLATWGMMGPFFAAYRVLTAFVSGIITGSFVDFFAPHHPTDKEHETSASDKVSDKPEQREGRQSKSVSFASRLRESIHYSFIDLPEDIGKSILIGLILSGLISALIPEGYFESYMNQPWLAYLAVSLFAVPLYVCSTGSIPLAVALVKGGVSPGAALVFLMLGPATNTVTLSAIWKLLGARRLLFYLVSLVGVAWSAGLALDFWAPESWAPVALSHGTHGEESGQWTWKVLVQWLAATSLGLVIVRPWILTFWKKWASYMGGRGSNAESSEEELVDEWTSWIFEVQGIECGNCARKIQNGLSGQKWVRNIVADPEKGEVRLETRMQRPLSVIRPQLEALGFETVGTK